MGGNTNDKYKVWFFAGGETRDDRFNIFTGSYPVDEGDTGR